MNKKWILIKDIVIPKGTLFLEAPQEKLYAGNGHVEALLPLTDDSYGTVTYDVGENNEYGKDLFLEVLE